jgi:hypothetical protein
MCAYNGDGAFRFEDGQMNIVRIEVAMLAEHRRQIRGSEAASAQGASIHLSVPDEDH